MIKERISQRMNISFFLLSASAVSRAVDVERVMMRESSQKEDD
jgi:hypothetical protein